MLTADTIALRSEAVAGSPQLRELWERSVERAARLLDEAPAFPEHKALLSVDGGVCPADRVALHFDPWSPGRHTCPRCGAAYQGERHDRHWARFQHLWLAERAAHLATVAVLGESRAADRAADIIGWYADRYRSFPNSDNVLGPSRLFFSTYLESIWLSHIMEAAWLLREGGLLPESLAERVSAMADESANLIGEFDEGFSNRQTWHNAALASVAVWFEDEGLAHRVIEGPTGLIAHLVHGFGADGLWYEGENYHFFAWQGLLMGSGWTRLAGVDLFLEPELAPRMERLLYAPITTALPDATFPARKDSRYGVSLAQPMYLELWEVTLARVVESGREAPGIGGWLSELYGRPAPPAQAADSYLDEADQPVPERRSRSDLSWRALLEMLPDLPEEEAYVPESTLVESHGLAVLRRADRYVSLECGPSGGGHGHPDRLHLTLFAGGVHWLPDPGTGSYVSADLQWYRSTLAHNAPMADCRSQPLGNAACRAFDEADGWSWVRGEFGDITRTVVGGPDHIVDLIESSGDEAHVLDIPWHLQGEWSMRSPGDWRSDAIDLPHAGDARRWIPQGEEPIRVQAVRGAAVLSLALVFPGHLWRLTGPGLPGARTSEFLLVRMRGTHLRCLALLVPGSGVEPRGLALDGDLVTVELRERRVEHQLVTGGWQVHAGAGPVRLEGIRPQAPDARPLVYRDQPLAVSATAPWVATIPARGEEVGAAAVLPIDHEDQYRRSEEPYPGPEDLSATARVAWAEGGLFLDLAVRKREVVARDPNGPPLLLDNEADDIHGDGLQVYLSLDGRVFSAVLALTPEEPAVRTRSLAGEGEVDAAWSATPDGYRVRALLTPSWWDTVIAGTTLGFDLVVNEARSGRQRRAGQLVWSGGGGWVWLRGDREDPKSFGTLVLG